MPQPNDRVEAPPNDIIDAIPADLPSDTAGMQRVVNIHITLCEQCQTLHYDPCLKYLFASTYPTTSRLEAQAAAENNDGTSSKDDAIWQQIYQAAATINPIAGTPNASRTEWQLQHPWAIRWIETATRSIAIAAGPANLPVLR
jgi:hypothetical protein